MKSHLAADLFDSEEHSEHVRTHDFSDVVGTVVSVQERLFNFGQVRRGIHIRWQKVDTVGIRTETDVIDSSYPRDVIDMVNQ